jgi:hypothetical protein
VLPLCCVTVAPSHDKAAGFAPVLDDQHVYGDLPEDDPRVELIRLAVNRLLGIGKEDFSRVRGKLDIRSDPYKRGKRVLGKIDGTRDHRNNLNQRVCRVEKGGALESSFRKIRDKLLTRAAGDGTADHRGVDHVKHEPSGDAARVNIRANATNEKRVFVRYVGVGRH